MSKRGTLLWIKGKAPYESMKVYSSKTVTVEDDDCKGCYDSVKDQIDISSEQPENGMKKTLMHELMHKVCDDMSGDLAERIFGKDYNAKEELIVSYMAPVLYDILSHHGWLRFPKPPKAKR
jgi:hypothetical protein